MNMKPRFGVERSTCDVLTAEHLSSICRQTKFSQNRRYSFATKFRCHSNSYVCTWIVLPEGLVAALQIFKHLKSTVSMGCFVSTSHFSQQNNHKVPFLVVLSLNDATSKPENVIVRREKTPCSPTNRSFKRRNCVLT